MVEAVFYVKNWAAPGAADGIAAPLLKLSATMVTCMVAPSDHSCVGIWPGTCRVEAGIAGRVV